MAAFPNLLAALTATLPAAFLPALAAMRDTALEADLPIIFLTAVFAAALVAADAAAPTPPVKANCTKTGRDCMVPCPIFCQESSCRLPCIWSNREKAVISCCSSRVSFSKPSPLSPILLAIAITRPISIASVAPSVKIPESNERANASAKLASQLPSLRLYISMTSRASDMYLRASSCSLDNPELFFILPNSCRALSFIAASNPLTRLSLKLGVFTDVDLIPWSISSSNLSSMFSN